LIAAATDFQLSHAPLVGIYGIIFNGHSLKLQANKRAAEIKKNAVWPKGNKRRRGTEPMM